MSRYSTFQSATKIRKQLSEFLSGNVDKPEVGWPRACSSPLKKKGTPGVTGTTGGLKVLLVGDLTLELPVEVKATRAELLAGLQDDSNAKRIPWKMSEARVGGFVAHAARAAATLGGDLSVCTVVPIPIPDRFEAFLDRPAIEKRFVTGLPGPTPVTVLLCCKDGIVVIRRRSVVSTVSVDWPSAARMDFDVILADPCILAGRSAIIHRLGGYLTDAPGQPVLGLRIDRRWTRSDLTTTRGEQVWCFVRPRDVRRLAEQLATRGLDLGDKANEDAVVKRLREACCIAKLVVQLGPRGAVLMNGLPCPYRVQTCPMEPVNHVGSGDTLLTVTTLSSASGADDRTSVRRGVAAATGHAVGLDPPRTLEELDVA